MRGKKRVKEGEEGVEREDKREGRQLGSWRKNKGGE